MDALQLLNPEWTDIGRTLAALWVYLGMVIIFAFSLLTALIVLPSLVESEHLPRRVLRLRPPLIVTALVAFGIALTFMAFAVDDGHVIKEFYPRIWI